MRRLALLALLILLLPGCVAPAGTHADAAPAFHLVRVSERGTEPTLGATRDGVLFVGGALLPDDGKPHPESSGAEAVYRSTDGGATWQDVLASAGPERAPADADPWLWVDPVAGRVFDAPDLVTCAWLAWSDDAGATWETNEAGGCGLPGHDHQHLSTGPPAPGIQTSGYPSVVYYAYNSVRPGTTPGVNASNPVFGSSVFEGSAVSVSLDGGRTFQNPVLVRGEDACAGGDNGPVAVAADGTAYVAMPSCEGVDVSASRDSGRTWETPIAVDAVGSQEGQAMDPSLAVGPDGVVRMAFEGADDRVYLATSRDAGRSWSEPVLVSPPEVKAAVFAVLLADDKGGLALAYLGTDSDPSTWQSHDPSDAPDSAVWHLYAARSADGASWRATRVTPADDPVQRGCIWTRGGANACRNLGDFMGATLVDGRLAIAYVDGCDACASAAESRREDVTVAVEQPAGG